MESFPKQKKEDLELICAAAVKPVAEGGVEIKDRKHHFKTYKQCFLGNEFVKWLISKNYAKSAEEATNIGVQCVEQLLLIHVVRDHTFKNEGLFYKFLYCSKERGYAVPELSWH